MNLTPPSGLDNTPSKASLINNAAIRLGGNAYLRQSSTQYSFSRSPIVASSSDRKTPEVARSASGRKKRQPWSKHEDALLLELVKQEARYKPNWPQVAARVNEAIDCGRTGKQCRERWQNHLRPNIKKGNWTLEEEEMIRNLHQTFGPKWSCMAKLMKNRTDNDIKNKWNSMVRSQRLNEARYSYATEFEETPSWDSIAESSAAGIYMLQTHGSANTGTTSPENNITARWSEGQEEVGTAKDAEIDRVARNLYDLEKVQL